MIFWDKKTFSSVLISFCTQQGSTTGELGQAYKPTFIIFLVSKTALDFKNWSTLS